MTLHIEEEQGVGSAVIKITVADRHRAVRNAQKRAFSHVARSRSLACGSESAGVSVRMRNRRQRLPPVY